MIAEIKERHSMAMLPEVGDEDVAAIKLTATEAKPISLVDECLETKCQITQLSK